jgi:hypothetical protein
MNWKTLEVALVASAVFFIGIGIGGSCGVNAEKGRVAEAACEQSCSPRKPVFADGLCGCVEAP